MNAVEFMKNLFLCMLFFTGIIICFFFIVSFITNIMGKKEEKSNVKVNVVNASDLELDEKTKKELDKIAKKLAKKYTDEILSDEYEKED